VEGGGGELVGILIRQARPLILYPATPKGQESDRQTRVGWRMVRQFIEIPWFAVSRNLTHKVMSLISSQGSEISCFWGWLSWIRFRNLLRKCLARGIRNAAWLSGPTIESRSPYAVRLLVTIACRSVAKASNLSSGREMRRLPVAIAHGKYDLEFRWCSFGQEFGFAELALSWGWLVVADKATKNKFLYGRSGRECGVNRSGG
jgi:hypothetical protein